ncbi:hypothetical protein MMC10_004207 [Thelotrema lepadinum]|nr:hypothetical protein [Thelotrema lepadinum]
MCFPFVKKADVEAGHLTIRRRYCPRRQETVLEVVRRRPKITEIDFWLCICGGRMHTDILMCSDCGRHRHHHHSLPPEPRPNLERCDTAFVELKKELDGLCKEVKELKESKEKKADKQPEPTHPLPPPPKCTPVIPQLPFVPLIPAPYLNPCPMPIEEPKPSPKPSPKPDVHFSPPPQPPFIINNIMPPRSETSRERPRRRRSPSPASSYSEVSVGSFQRVRRHVNVIGRRLWHLEDKEALRDETERREVLDELRFRREADGRRRIMDAEESIRHKAIDFERDELVRRERKEREREREAEWELDAERRQLDRREHRERARERGFWRRREWEWSPARALPMHYHMPRKPFGWVEGPYVERWEGERRLVD